MKIFSSAFISALISIYFITPSQAREWQVMTITPEIIEGLYRDEMRFPGATVTCYQAGKEIINEPGLKDLNIRDDGMSAWRLDGSRFTLQTFKNGSNVSCTVINRKEQE